MRSIFTNQFGLQHSYCLQIILIWRVHDLLSVAIYYFITYHYETKQCISCRVLFWHNLTQHRIALFIVVIIVVVIFIAVVIFDAIVIVIAVTIALPIPISNVIVLAVMIMIIIVIIVVIIMIIIIIIITVSYMVYGSNSPMCYNRHARLCTGLILGLRQANERRRYNVTPSLVGWAQTKPKISPDVYPELIVRATFVRHKGLLFITKMMDMDPYGWQTATEP